MIKMSKLLSLIGLFLISGAIVQAQVTPPQTANEVVLKSEPPPEEVLEMLEQQFGSLKLVTAKASEIRRHYYYKLKACENACREGMKLERLSKYRRAKNAYRLAVENEILMKKKIEFFLSTLPPEVRTTLNPRTNLALQKPEVDGSGNAAADANFEVDYMPGGPITTIDDPYIPEFDSFELNIMTTFQRLNKAQPDEIPFVINPLYVDFNYGLTKDIQLKIEAGIPTVTGGNGAAFQSGFNVWLVGVKFKIYGREQGFATGVYPQYGQDGDSKFLYVPWLISYNQKQFAIVANFGYQRGLNRHEVNPDAIAFGIAVGLPVTKDLALMGEAFFTKDVTGHDRGLNQQYTAGFRFANAMLRSKRMNIFSSAGFVVATDGRSTFIAKGGLQVNPGSVFHRKNPEDNKTGLQ